MRPAQLNAARNHPKRVAGALLIALGATTLLGWLTRTPVLFEYVHGLVPMVFNTGASFFLCGVALCLSPNGGSTWAARKVIAIAVAALMVLTLVETALDVGLGVDLAFLQTWYDYGNTRPGRMAPNTALAFLLVSVALLLRQNVESRRAAIAHVALTFAVMAIGLVGLVGYLLAPDLLFGWARSARMALHTATGVIVASVGLWVTWSRRDWYVGERFLHQGEKIRLLSGAVVVVVTLTAGLTGFVLLQHSLEASLEDRLATTARNRGPWLHALVAEVATSSESAAQVAGLPMAGSEWGHAEVAVDLREAARRLLRAGIRSVTFKDGAGKVLASFGRRSESPAFDAPLDETGDIALVWDRELRIRTRHQLGHTNRGTALPAETVELESEASRLQRLLFDVSGLGPASEVTACQRRGDTLLCLPDAFNSTVFTVPLKLPPRQPLPMQRALTEAGPGIARGLDYRGHNVIAAYGTLAPGIGFVAKQDTVEAYAPIKAALGLGAPVIALLALAGAAAMNSQLHPLLRRMRRSERLTATALARNVAVRNAVGEGILTLDGDGRVESSNLAAQSMLGFAAGELDGMDFLGLLPRKERDHYEDDFRLALEGGDLELFQMQNLELRGLRSDGTEFPLELTLNATADSSERLFVAVIRDITARLAAQKKIRDSEHHLRGIADNLPVLIAYVDSQEQLLFANKTFGEWLGFDPKAVVKKPLRQLGTSLFEDRPDMLKQALQGQRASFESVLNRGDGSVRHLHTVYIPDAGTDGQVVGVYALSMDVTAAKEVERHLEQLSRVDQLTGLSNRRSFEERLKQAMARSRRSKRPMALVLIDVDFFKQINDTYGHAAGDAVLKEFAARLQGTVRMTDMAARLGGDEFVVVVESLNTVAEASIVSEKLESAIRAPITLDGEIFQVTASMGLAYYEGHGSSPEALVAKADRALYRAKAAGRDTFVATII